MAREHEDSKLPPVATVVTLLLAAGAYFLIQEPLKSSRPIGLGGENIPLPNEELVLARLWQDPFAAVEAHEQREKDAVKVTVKLEPHALGTPQIPLRYIVGDVDIEEVHRQHHHTIGSIFTAPFQAAIPKGHAITVLIVLTDDSPYGEGTESRIRDRYALLSALSVACYSPKDEEHIRYFKGLPVAQGSHIPSDPDFIVPYEWYEKRPTRQCMNERGNKPDTNDTKADEILVIWIKDQSFPGFMLRLLNSLAWELQRLAKPHTNKGDQTPFPGKSDQVPLRFKIIGPRDSSSLEQLIKEAHALEKQKLPPLAWPNEGVIDLFSPWSSTDLGEIAFSLRNTTSSQTKSLADYVIEATNALVFAGVQRTYSIPNDDRLFDAIIEELALRRVDAATDTIVLVGEWDTIYGRALPNEFYAAACARAFLIGADSKQTECPHLLRQQFHSPVNFLQTSFPMANDKAIALLCTLLPMGTIDITGHSARLGFNPSVACHPGSAPSTDSDIHSVSQLVRKRIFQEALSIVASSPQQMMSNIHRYGYMRGLDGLVSQKSDRANSDGKKSSKDKSEGKTGEDLTALNVQYLERPEGRSQFDYVRRLGQQIKDEHGQANAKREFFKKMPKNVPIGAIGILGTDVYDELLILQALRHEFPGTLFFSTDLDARLLLPGENKWARNLLVASAFDLRLQQDLQHDIPSFRSSYQTSTFFAVLLALNHIRCQGTISDGSKDCTGSYVADLAPVEYRAPIEPLIFEIGRNGAVNMSIDDPTSRGPYNIHPFSQTRTLEGESIIKVGIVLCLIAFIVMPTATRSWHLLERYWHFWLAFGLFMFTATWGWKVVMVAPLLGLVIWAVSYVALAVKVRARFLVSSKSAIRKHLLVWSLMGVLLGIVAMKWPKGIFIPELRQEPFSLLDGVSIWPSLILVLIGFWLSLFFMVKVWNDLTENRMELESSSHFVLRPHKLKSVAPTRNILWRIGKRARRARMNWGRRLQYFLSWMPNDPSPTSQPINNATHHLLLLRDYQSRRAWMEYQNNGRIGVRMRRVSALMFAIGFLLLIFNWFYSKLMDYQVGPVFPCRGVSCDMYWIAASFGILLFYALAAFVFDEMRLCGQWIKRLGEQCDSRPPATQLFYRNLIKLIGKRTNIVAPLIYYPLCIYLIIMVSRNTLFDNWIFPPPFIIWSVVMMILILGGAILLKQAAEQVRRKALTCLEDMLVGVTSANPITDGAIRDIIEDIRSTNQGAFKSVLQQPALTGTILTAAAVLQHFLP